MRRFTGVWLLTSAALISSCAAHSLGTPAAATATCPQVGLAEVSARPSSGTHPVGRGRKTIHVHDEWLSSTREIADIQLRDWYGDAEIRIQLVPEAARRLEANTTNRSGMRIAFLYDDNVLNDVIWQGEWGVPATGSQLHVKGGIGLARRMMAALQGCTSGTVRDESRLARPEKRG